MASSNPLDILQVDPTNVVEAAQNSKETLMKLKDYALKLQQKVDAALAPVKTCDLEKEEEKDEDTGLLSDNGSVSEKEETQHEGDKKRKAAPSSAEKPQKRAAKEKSATSKRSIPRKAGPSKKDSAAASPPKPRPPTGKHNGSLETSSLRRSCGVTREYLNPKRTLLGLGGKFGQPVVTKNSADHAQPGAISHLTFNLAVNQLPKDTEEPLQYWLGTGSGRLSLASTLNPLEHKQHDIPVFCSVAQKGRGGALVHYVGHFRSSRFIKLDKPVDFLGKPRQALIELDFVKFDEELSKKMTQIAREVKSTS